MTIKKIIIILVGIIHSCLLQAQRLDVQHKFYATTEEDVYKLYDQMLDSARLSNWYIDPLSNYRFGISFFREINCRDTLMKFEQSCRWYFDNSFVCRRFYNSYISNNQPIDFYERFMNYLDWVGKRENLFIKKYSTNPLICIRKILIDQYESRKLDSADSIKALELIELAALRMINDGHRYSVLDDEEYFTDNIRQALINVINNPFFPEEYLNFYMSIQDTLDIDTVGISNRVKELAIRGRGGHTLEEAEDYFRVIRFLSYQRRGEEMGGLSPGQAYLQRRRDWFPQKGYLPINTIADYAYKNQDELLIKHLKEFKIKHPDYPLKHF